MKGTQDGWFVASKMPFNLNVTMKAWCQERWGDPHFRNKNGIWDRNWQGFLFKNECDYIEFLMVWS